MSVSKLAHSPANIALHHLAMQLKLAAVGIEHFVEEHPDACSCKICRLADEDWKDDLAGVAWQSRRAAADVTRFLVSPGEFEASAEREREARRRGVPRS